MAALARIIPKMASAHSIRALANEDEPPIDAEHIDTNIALSIRSAARPPINPAARVPSSPIGPHPLAVGKEDCTDRTISGIPRKANNPNTMIETSAEMDCHTHRFA